jgi:hypothetical protein
VLKGSASFIFIKELNNSVAIILKLNAKKDNSGMCHWQRKEILFAFWGRNR